MELTAATEIQIKGTPSLLYNNLSTALDDRLVYVSKGDVCIASSAAVANAIRVTLPAEGDDASVTPMAYNVRCPNPKQAVAVSSANLYVIDVTNGTVVSTTPLPVKGSTAVVAHTTTVSSLHIVGFGNGAVAVLPTGRSEILHKDSVTDLAVSHDFVVSGDANGSVCFWNHTTMKLMWTNENPNGDCVTSVCMMPGTNLVAASFGSGHVRLYRVDTGAMVCELAAHSRWINGMVYSASKKELVTVSEDMLVCCWSIVEESASKPAVVALRAHKQLKDALLTGVALTNDERHLVASVFDSDKIHVFNY